MKTPLAHALLLVLAAASPQAIACEVSLPLDGSTLFVEGCDVRKETCVAGAQALNEYAKAGKDDPSVLSVSLQTSPWRLYDPEWRIVSPQEFAEFLRPHLKPEIKSVRLEANWTAASPGAGHASLAEQVASAIGGIPVEGRDGFVWFMHDGSIRETKQSFTARYSGSYMIKPGADVMTALIPGWAAQFEDELAKQKDANGVLLAAVGWDAFMLCPDRALQGFERADSLGSAIGAYNAAVMRLDRGQDGDRAAALALLERAAKRGDAKSAALLAKLQG